MKKILVIVFSFILVFTLTGCVTEEYTITFETNGGTEVASIIVEEGDTFIEPDVPILGGYSFGGWYSDSNFNVPYDFNSLVVGDFKLYAKFTINIHTVSFETNGGNTIDDMEIPYGEFFYGDVVDPEKTGYEFIGWEVDGESFDLASNRMPDNDITLSAIWEVIN